ncbi:ABC transporter substrate-binding protein [Pectobacteriaceae bacterium CE70]|uniref:ABC transporter substrate-binding protein n=1 Tax=Serratia sp. (strain ATCC 39006) TaxID=104623 RepID=A0A2I5THS3_SERS3|nr:ABC transporter substrate-binding protein [Serratia sp. ATCC 39006]WJV61682.1 ABC transporter substrate-binding protein [Pectobacteriaceae bacterium C52]WJV65957.1 ABC transporter substrate-binding protein [Pectobacteriaceae bacterium CE70]WJY09976.1 ABC transporter substrate-binding protein [Pectobacteriaceae bacterium C80]AUG99792.1 ABC transporter substrate-binding protein [Serratia sp. ATCC 39006]AUH04111.1 ABC transporter substrate-binding protein [Serratia sp. ATCC 39006]
MLSLRTITFSLAAACCLGVLASTTSLAASAPESGELKLGVEPWLGYGQWHVAAAQNLYKKNGLEKVDIINFAEDKDINAALASGQIDAASIATHTAMGMISAGLPVKIVLLLDQSQTADAMLVSKDVKTLKDLKGKRVAYEEGTTSDILLRSALSSVGMSLRDIKPVPMPAASAGSSLIAKRVPVAVTYEPYLSVAMKADPSVKMLYSGKNDPGLISDVLVVRDDMIKNRPGQIAALIKTWGAAVTHYQANTTADRAVIAKAVGSTPEDLRTAFNGIKYYTLAENKQQLSHEFSNKTFPHVLKAATDAGIVTRAITPKEAINASFVNAE